jgi:predicted O-methyltransferase YrrM
MAIDTVSDILAISAQFRASAALHAALKLGIFASLGSSGKQAAEVAADIKGTMPESMLLLNALVGMGLLVKKEQLYLNTRLSLRHLVPSSKDYVGHLLWHRIDMYSDWGRLDEGIKGRRPLRESHFKDKRELRNFIKGMEAEAKVQAEALAGILTLGRYKRMLDLGGGPGYYAITFAKQAKNLACVVYDRKEVVELAEENIAKQALSSRISTCEGDYTKAPLPAGFDLVLISQTLHAYSIPTITGVFKKVFSALEQGGVLVVHEFVLDDSLCRPVVPALFSLNMIVHEKQGRSYGFHEYRAMLSEAGFEALMLRPLAGPFQSSLVIARKPFNEKLS